MKHFFKPSKYFLTYGPNEPALKIKSGDKLIVPTVDARGYDSNGMMVPKEMMQSREDTVLHPSNLLSGPFYIEDAEVGDTLLVHIKKIRLNRPTAWSAVVPHFGSFTEEDRRRRFLLNKPLERMTFDWKLDLDKNIGVWELNKSKLKTVEIPLHPFIGSIGVAPRYGRWEMSLTPGEYGGNMDCPETCEGATLQLPVFVRGGYLVLGDIHAAQGDGELCGVALETTAEVTLNIEVHKGKEITWPRLEDEEYIMVVGSSRPLMVAYKIAHKELIDWMVDDYGFDRWEALQLLSQVGRCRIGNVVDPNYSVVAKFPKKYLP